MAIYCSSHILKRAGHFTFTEDVDDSTKLKTGPK